MILLAPFLFALFDQTVVGTALPVIVTDLHGNDLCVRVVTISTAHLDDQRPDLTR